MAVSCEQGLTCDQHLWAVSASVQHRLLQKAALLTIDAWPGEEEEKVKKEEEVCPSASCPWPWPQQSDEAEQRQGQCLTNSSWFPEDLKQQFQAQVDKSSHSVHWAEQQRPAHVHKGIGSVPKCLKHL